MKKLLLQILLIWATAVFAQAEQTSSQFDASRLVFTSMSGPIRNAVIYPPKPVYPRAALEQHLSGRGVYKMDLDSGTPYDVRVVQSSGSKILDDAAVETLRTWRFLPHRLNWVTIPIEFRAQDGPSVATHPKGAKRVAIYAPKPEYPYEARSKHWTGSGIILLDVDVSTGEVTEARMLKSIGYRVLDDAAMKAVRRWRFAPGTVAPHVKIPITYTMTGAHY